MISLDPLRSIPLVRWSLIFVLAAGGSAAGQAPVRPPAAKTKAAAAPASPADPGKLNFRKWSGPLNIPDPVAISLDHQGRAYVTQTQRRKAQDLDIRANREWIPFDVGFRSIDEKRAFYHEQLAIGGNDEEAARHVDDWNEDGVHDWRDLTVLSERIHRVEDTDGDGTADRRELFAEGFQTEVTGIAAGVLWHQGDVYATIAPDLWRLQDTDGDGRADQRRSLAHGFGLHIAYAGHDMHGLTVGPDGKIYWSVGDKGIHVNSGGREFAFPNQGGVMRCNPDGSDFEIYAHGLRNVQELAFDAYGNLFGVDNDADGANEKERFVFIVPEMDAGWRCNFQYKRDGFCPWWDEGIWKTWFAEQPAYIVPPISHYQDGPAGFAFNPGTALNAAYRDYFFLTGAPNGFQYAFRTEPHGASFRMVDAHQIGKGIPLVGINFGPDGALYGVDWGGGYPLNQAGAIWKIDAPEAADDPLRQETERLLGEGFTERSADDLVAWLGHADQRVRLGAQFALVQRHDAARLLATANGSDATPLLARVHAIWGIGQLARAAEDRQPVQGQAPVALAGSIASWLTCEQPEIRCQAAKLVRDLQRFDGNLLLPLLADPEPPVQLQAALAAARHPVAGLRKAAVRLLEANGGRDQYLRHAGIVALTACDEVAGLAAHADAQVRLAAVVALRRQRAAAVAGFLVDEDPAVVAEAARAIHDDWSIPSALPALAESLLTVPPENSAAIRRAINANFRLGGKAAAERLAAFAAIPDAPQAMRGEALTALSLWSHPPLLDRVDGRRRQWDPATRTVPRARLTAALSELVAETEGDLKRRAVVALRELDLPIAGETLIELVAAETVPASLRIEALRSLDRSDLDTLRQAIAQGLDANSEALRIAALEMLAPIDPSAATRRAIAWLQQRPVGPPQQAAMELLGKLETDEAAAHVQQELAAAIAATSPSAWRLELLATARAKASTHPRIAAQLAAYEAERKAAFLSPEMVRFGACLEGGDADAGRQIFQTHLAAQCTRCHKVGGRGSDVGPDLKGIAQRRDPQHLLRALVEPSADIDKEYLSQTFLLFTGEVVQGIVQEKTDAEWRLVDNRGKERRIVVDEIEEESTQRVSIMPPMTDVLSLPQIRDLVAYLKSLK